MIYTINAVEALHRSLRKIIKTRGSFPNDDAALKLLYLAIRNAGLRWRRGTEWTTAMGQFAIQFSERLEGRTLCRQSWQQRYATLWRGIDEPLRQATE